MVAITNSLAVRGIRAGEVALFFRRLHTMVVSGISLPDSMVYLERGEANPAFRQVLASCLDTLLKGYPLSMGFKRYPQVFGVLSVEMVATGESTGALSCTFGHLAQLAERNIERKQRIKSALAYPTCLFVVMVLVVALFVTFVAPGDEGLFSALGDDIPWPSQVLIGISSVVTNPLLMVGLGGGALTLALLFRRSYHQSPEFRLSIDSGLLGLPVLGKLISALESARCLDVLATSLSVGLTIVQALKNSLRVVSNEKFRRDLEAANQAIIEGSGLGAALAANTSIPRFATSLIEVSEEAGALDGALDRCARILDEQVNDALERAVVLAEPLLLALGGTAAGFVAIATFLPIMRLIAEL